MRVLKLTAYYPPEKIPSANMEKEIEKVFVNNNIGLTVLTPYPSRGCNREVRAKYKKTESLYNNQILIKRFPLMNEPRNSVLRMGRYLAGNVIQYFYAIKEKNVDVIFAGTTPPTQVVLARKVAKKLHKPYVLRVQDIFPDSLVTSGISSKNSFIYRLGIKIVKKAYRDASEIMVIGDEMMKNLIEKGVDKNKISVVRNWINPNEIKPIDKENNRLFKEFGLTKEKFYVVYAGNIGKVQNIITLVEVANILKKYTDIHFLVFGEGVEKENVTKYADALNLKNISFFPLQAKEKISEVYSLGDISVILCQKGAGESAVPSKTWSIMSTGTPIVASFDKDSELCDLISKIGCGICVEPENPKQLSECIIYIYNNKQVLENMKKQGRDYVKKYIASDVCMEKYIKVIESAYKNNL